jgi:hypothetical protein
MVSPIVDLLFFPAANLLLRRVEMRRWTMARLGDKEKNPRGYGFLAGGKFPTLMSHQRVISGFSDHPESRTVVERRQTNDHLTVE